MPISFKKEEPKPTSDRTINAGDVIALIGVGVVIGVATVALVAFMSPRESLPPPGFGPPAQGRNADVRSEVLPSLDYGATLTLGRFSPSNPISSQPISVHNNLTTAMSMVAIECGFYRNGDLLDVKNIELADIQPNGDGVTNTFVDVTRGVPDLVRCRISAARPKGRK